jgi:murein DD-endopeptidase MepM/ murein hydrolase activator NlpD
MAKELNNKKEHWIRKLRNKYRLVIVNEETFDERLSFRLSRLNVFVIIGTLVILLIVATTFLIAFTPLREYIPGYTDVTLSQKAKYLQHKVDSLEVDFRRKSLYIQNLKSIIEGKVIESDTSIRSDENVDYDNIKYVKSPEDSILRAEYENESSYDLYYNESDELYTPTSPLNNYYFFAPLKGIITNEFNLTKGHYGIDIVAKDNEAVKTTLSGTVIFSDWTVETGYVIAIQHQGNLISVYKHNSVLLKQEGNVVKAGDPIAIVGESGELSTGPHLHFELWLNGAPVNPRDYMVF